MAQRDEKGYIRYSMEELQRIPSFEQREAAATMAGRSIIGGTAGALAGAAAGSLFGPVGTIVGGTGGALAGGAVGRSMNRPGDR